MIRITSQLLVRVLYTLSILQWAAACSDDDLVVTVNCRVPDQILSTTFRPLDPSDSSMGLLDGNQGELGTVFKLSPSRDGSAPRWLPVYQLSTIRPVRSRNSTLHSDVVRVDFDVSFELSPIPPSVKTDAMTAVRSGTKIVLYDVVRESLQNILHTIDNDPGALSIIRAAGADDWFAVTSSIVSASAGVLTYAPDGRDVPTSFTALETSRSGTAYLHYKYSCPLLAQLRSGSTPGKARPITVSYYTGVQFDRATHRTKLVPVSPQATFWRIPHALPVR